MSCRVLKRGMENFTLNTIVKYAENSGCTKIVGEYLPTSKNGMVKEHYKNLGFRQLGEQWHLDVKDYINRKCFINLNTNE